MFDGPGDREPRTVLGSASAGVRECHRSGPVVKPSRMRGAIATALTGLGLTIASSFASSLGLSVREQRVAFAFGIFLMVCGVTLFFYQRRVVDPLMTSRLPPTVLAPE